jgi:hypothetical protein
MPLDRFAMDDKTKDSDENENKVRVLTLVDTIKNLLLGELKAIIYNHPGSAYIKFLNLAIGIEYLGACLDEHPFDKDKESEKRFNEALKELFDKKYAKYAKKGSDIYFFEDFRCGFVHQLRPSKKIVLTHREESKKEGTKHLFPLDSGELVLILEDFYDDFEKAAESLIWQFENGKITNKKGEKGFIKLVSIKDNK